MRSPSISPHQIQQQNSDILPHTLSQLNEGTSAKQCGLFRSPPEGIFHERAAVYLTHMYSLHEYSFYLVILVHVGVELIHGATAILHQSALATSSSGANTAVNVSSRA
ncbi:hypothetical protein GLAREA_10088 [Glarea lozoyensis ATCC 20868]|uniref:Uncharacterized protein n=1 Tax=Glarea lozoyensis (strain ATCC 20868 / MF5171) TaxID=1116229 RepID=S3DBB3_GLAL2|nr:uncharacterized protein GLAREA_10088 [Glarea lozoyensis ATCC 20868]EPE34394.1 hypothetical protein GLAREA_10088 [Glarea lozoyensis ATCC 20868]